MFFKSLLSNIKKHLWFLKIMAKLILSWIPIKYQTWSKIGLFKHGGMDDYNYAWEVLSNHYKSIGSIDKWEGIEIGPGDGVLSSLLAPALGSTGLTLVDEGNFINFSDNKYIDQINKFQNDYPELILPNYSDINDVNQMLTLAGGSYHTGGLESLKKLKTQTYDLIFSQAVLEHIKIVDFKKIMFEIHRLLKPDGTASHVVDYKDHLVGGLNNLRFSSEFWEKNWFASKGRFYTNRIRLSEMIKICESIGFNVKIVKEKKWEIAPIKRKNLAEEFRELSDDDLLISGAHLIMNKKK